MPAESFMQQFHNLAAPEEEVRCRAALTLKKTLVADSENGGDNENRDYAIKRLVRGIQSSRQCARQGFSLALSEILMEHPSEMANVLTQTDLTTQLQSGLKASEHKDRLLGRLFTYVAVVQSGCLARSVSDEKGGKAERRNALKDFGRGLYEAFASRPYLRTPCAQLMADLCRDLCKNGLAADVPFAIEAFGVLNAFPGEDAEVDIDAGGLIWLLRRLHDEVSKGGIAASALKNWPESTRTNVFTNQALLTRCVRALAGNLSSTPVGDALPSAFLPFCEWWLYEGTIWNDLIWGMLDEVLFPEKATHSQQSQAFRAIGDIIAQLSSIEATGAEELKDSLVVSFFANAKKGVHLMFRALCWTRAPVHAAAKYANQQIIKALTFEQIQANNKNAKADVSSSATSGFKLSDTARLSIIADLQKFQAFKAVPNIIQRQYSEMLATPLSPIGVRARLLSIFQGLGEKNKSKSEQPSAIDHRALGSQLEQLTMHTRASDEVILSSIFFLFNMAYLEPSKKRGCKKSLNAFCDSVGLKIPHSGDDIEIPLMPHCEGSQADDRAVWRTRFWSTLRCAVRRPLPDLAETMRQQNGEGDGEDDTANEGVYSADEDAAAATLSIRSTAFFGCLSDGSLLILRLHQWWDFATSSSRGETKKKANATDAPEVAFVGGLSDDDLARRKSCIERCQQLLKCQDKQGEFLKTRQRNALCNLLLSIVMQMTSSVDKRERKMLRVHVDEVESAIARLVEAKAPKSDKKNDRTKVIAKIAELIQVVPRVAAELFVNGTGLVKEASASAWRQLGEIIQDATLSSVCDSVVGAPPEDDEGEGPESEDDSEESDAEQNPAVEAKIAKFQQATEKLKKEREAEKATADNGDVEMEMDGEDVLTMDSNTMFQEFLAEGENDSERQSLLASFADSGLDDSGAKSAQLTKRQKKLREKQEDLTRKFREVELLEAFLVRHGDKRKLGTTMMQSLYTYLLDMTKKSSQKNRLAEGSGSADKKKKSGKKSRSRGDKVLYDLELTFGLRIAKLLQRALRQVSRSALIGQIASWRDADDWANSARDLFNTSLNSGAVGRRHLPIGTLLLFFFCAAHNAVLGDERWTLAEELSKKCLESWGTKKDAEHFCEAVLTTFACRAPQAVLGLPWFEAIRNSSAKAYAQRSQVAFVADHLLKGQVLAEHAAKNSSVNFAVGFLDLCAELLESTLDGSSPSQHKSKLRNETLRGMKMALRLRVKVSDATSKRVAKATAGVRDSLAVRHGRVYQLCLHALRGVQQTCGSDSVQDNESAPPAKKARTSK